MSCKHRASWNGLFRARSDLAHDMTISDKTTPKTQGHPWRRRLLTAFKWMVLVDFVAIALVVTGMWLTGLRLGVDVQRLIGEPACMPSLFYLWHPGLNQPPKVGDYIVALMPDSGMKVGARPGDRIVKKVAAVAGDRVTVQGTELTVNGLHIDRLWLAKSLPGKQTGDYDREITLGEEEVFLMGTNKESFDSRYWGPIQREKIIGYAIPLL